MSDELPTFALFSEQPGNDVAAMFAILVGAMIAAGGGLGGGGVFVPIYILILNYPPKFAAALSQATIFGGSIVNLIMNLRKHHPSRPHRPIIDFSTLLIFEPMLLVGTIIGVLFNVMFPDILILILLAIVLSYATTRTTRKGIRLWKKETNEMKDSSDDTEKDGRANMEMQSVESEKNGNIAKMNGHDESKDTEDGQTQNITASDDIEDGEEKRQNDKNRKSASQQSKDALVVNGHHNENDKESKIRLASVSVVSADSNNNNDKEQVICRLADGCGVEPSQITSDKIEACQEFIDREGQMWRPMGYILVVWIAVSLFAILKKDAITGVRECGGGYWVLTFLPFPIMMGVSYYMTKKEYDNYQIKINSGCWVPAFGDIELTGDFVRILKYPLIASVAGILGGLLGIGGGMIVSPLLIELGVVPTVAAATSAMAVLITSSSAMLQFLLLGFLQWDYTLFFMFIGVLGTYIGQTAVNYAVKEYGRVSVVIFAVAIIMGLAIFLMLINGIVNLVDGVSWAFAPPC